MVTDDDCKKLESIRSLMGVSIEGVTEVMESIELTVKLKNALNTLTRKMDSPEFAANYEERPANKLSKYLNSILVVLMFFLSI